MVVLSVALLGACSAAESAPTTTTYPWEATSEEGGAVSAARQMDGEAAGVWAPYSDGLLLHHIYEFCDGLVAAPDVEQYLNEGIEAQGAALLLPLVIGSGYLCGSEAVGDWIAEQAANE